MNNELSLRGSQVNNDTLKPNDKSLYSTKNSNNNRIILKDPVKKKKKLKCFYYL